jgi:hypothetical protein
MIVFLLLGLSRPATADPGTFIFVEDPRCDPHDITLAHELGEAPAFPIDELISAVSFGIGAPLTCPLPPSEMPSDFIVTITNLSPFSWMDLFFVADAGIMVGNADGTIKGGDAFKIDTSGINTPLLSESISADLIFEPGESWDFYVQWFFPAPPDIMGSLGVGSESDDTTGSSWSSIVAIRVDGVVPVPEPGSLALVAVGIAALGAVAVRGRWRGQ